MKDWMERRRLRRAIRGIVKKHDVFDYRNCPGIEWGAIDRDSFVRDGGFLGVIFRKKYTKDAYDIQEVAVLDLWDIDAFIDDILELVTGQDAVEIALLPDEVQVRQILEECLPMEVVDDFKKRDYLDEYLDFHVKAIIKSFRRL